MSVLLALLLAGCGGDVTADPAWSSTEDFGACTTDQGAWIVPENADVIDDQLVVTASYEGGCAEHAISVCWPLQTFYDADPPLVKLELYHDPMGDTCTDWITDTIEVELTPVRERYADVFGEPSGEVGIVVEGLERTLLYSF